MNDKATEKQITFINTLREDNAFKTSDKYRNHNLENAIRDNRLTEAEVEKVTDFQRWMFEATPEALTKSEASLMIDGLLGKKQLGTLTPNRGMRRLCYKRSGDFWALDQARLDRWNAREIENGGQPVAAEDL